MVREFRLPKGDGIIVLYVVRRQAEEPFFFPRIQSAFLIADDLT